MRRNRTLALGAMLLALISACWSGGGSKPTIKIGSVGFDEAKVMAEIYAQALEAKGYTVDRTGIGLGDRAVLAPGHRERPDRPPTRVHRQPDRRLRDPGQWLHRPGAERRLSGQLRIAPTGAECEEPDRAQLHAGHRHERLRRPCRDGQPVQPDQDERHRRGAGPAQVGPRD